MNAANSVDSRDFNSQKIRYIEEATAYGKSGGHISRTENAATSARQTRQTRQTRQNSNPRKAPKTANNNPNIKPAEKTPRKSDDKPRNDKPKPRRNEAVSKIREAEFIPNANNNLNLQSLIENIDKDKLLIGLVLLTVLGENKDRKNIINKEDNLPLIFALIYLLAG